MKHSIRDEFHGVAVFVGAMWAVYLLDLILPIRLAAWGIVPRTLWGLVGIPLCPFLHASWTHLVGNTVPLVILLMLLAGSRTRSWETVAEIVLAGGGLLWLFGRSADHVGASGLVYGLIAFLIVAGLREKRPVSLLVAMLVGFLYGWSLLWSVLPTIGSHVSWDGHLCSAIAGAWLGYRVVKTKTRAEGYPALPDAA